MGVLRNIPPQPLRISAMCHQPTGGIIPISTVRIRPLLHPNKAYAHFGQWDPSESDMHRVPLWITHWSISRTTV